jgi:hypothetical protein
MLITTTHVTIKRPNGSGDPYETATAPTIGSAVAAHISAPSGTDANVGGAEERIDAIGLLPSGANVQRADIVVDNLTAKQYRVGTVMRRTGLGLDYVKATLIAVAGGSNGG